MRLPIFSAHFFLSYCLFDISFYFDAQLSLTDMNISVTVPLNQDSELFPPGVIPATPSTSQHPLR